MTLMVPHSGLVNVYAVRHPEQGERLLQSGYGTQHQIMVRTS